MKTCTYCVLFGLDWIYYRSLVLPPLFTFHYFKLSHTVRPLLVNHNHCWLFKTPFHLYFFHSYFSLISTHFHFSFFDNSLSRFAVWNSLSLFIVGNQASPKLVVPPSCEPKFASSAITFKAHQTTLFGGSGGSKCGQQKYKIEFALSLVNVNFQTFAGWLKSPSFGLFVSRYQCPLVRSDSLISPSKPKAWYRRPDPWPRLLTGAPEFGSTHKTCHGCHFGFLAVQPSPDIACWSVSKKLGRVVEHSLSWCCTRCSCVIIAVVVADIVIVVVVVSVVTNVVLSYVVVVECGLSDRLDEHNLIRCSPQLPFSWSFVWLLMIMVIGGRVSICVVIAGVESLCWFLLLILFYLVDVISSRVNSHLQYESDILGCVSKGT